MNHCEVSITEEKFYDACRNNNLVYLKQHRWPVEWIRKGFRHLCKNKHTSTIIMFIQAMESLDDKLDMSINQAKWHSYIGYLDYIDYVIIRDFIPDDFNNNQYTSKYKIKANCLMNSNPFNLGFIDIIKCAPVVSYWIFKYHSTNILTWFIDQYHKYSIYDMTWGIRGISMSKNAFAYLCCKCPYDEFMIEALNNIEDGPQRQYSKSLIIYNALMFDNLYLIKSHIEKYKTNLDDIDKTLLSVVYHYGKSCTDIKSLWPTELHIFQNKPDNDLSTTIRIIRLFRYPILKNAINDLINRLYNNDLLLLDLIQWRRPLNELAKNPCLTSKQCAKLIDRIMTCINPILQDRPKWPLSFINAATRKVSNKNRFDTMTELCAKWVPIDVAEKVTNYNQKNNHNCYMFKLFSANNMSYSIVYKYNSDHSPQSYCVHCGELISTKVPTLSLD